MVKVFDIRPHRRRTETLQSYSPGGANVHPIYRKTKVVAMATSLSCRVSAISAFCWPTTQTPSITNCIDAIVHTKPVIAILVSKLVAVATTLRHTISDISSSDSLTPTTHPWNQTVCRWLSYNQNYSPSKAKNWLPWQRPSAPMDPHLGPI